MATLLLDAQNEAANIARKQLESEQKALRNRLTAVVDRLAYLDEVPELPEPTASGSVIRFRKYDQKYWFAAIKINTRWYVTQDGSRSPSQGKAPLLWNDLIAWIGQRNYQTVEVLS